MSFCDCNSFLNDWKRKTWFSFQSHLQIKVGDVSEHQEAKYVQMGWKLYSMVYLMDHRNEAAARHVPASGELAQTTNGTFPELDSLLAQSRWQEQFPSKQECLKYPGTQNTSCDHVIIARKRALSQQLMRNIPDRMVVMYHIQCECFHSSLLKSCLSWRPTKAVIISIMII